MNAKTTSNTNKISKSALAQIQLSCMVSDALISGEVSHTDLPALKGYQVADAIKKGIQFAEVVFD